MLGRRVWILLGRRVGKGVGGGGSLRFPSITHEERVENREQYRVLRIQVDENILISIPLHPHYIGQQWDPAVNVLGEGVGDRGIKIKPHQVLGLLWGGFSNVVLLAGGGWGGW